MYTLYLNKAGNTKTKKSQTKPKQKRTEHQFLHLQQGEIIPYL